MFFLVLIACVVFVESVNHTPAMPDGVEKQAGLSPVTSVKTGIIIFLYVAADSSSWNDVIAVKHQHPALPIIVIVNSGDNPGTVDPAYVQRIDMLASSGITVLGYVSTDKGQLNLDQVLYITISLFFLGKSYCKLINVLYLFAVITLYYTIL